MAEKKYGKTSGNSSANMPPSRRQLPDWEEMLQNEKTEFKVPSYQLYVLSYMTILRQDIP